jgi:bifunctional pyridoxal-dependent enzyme with beta-cystathionase and maltose regulon repressor activities
MKYRLTKAANNLEGQPMFKVLAKVKDLERQGEDIVHFEIGDPDFNTPENITNAAIESLKRGETHYQSSYGMTEFRELVREATLHSRGFKPDLDQVLIAPSANIIIYYNSAILSRLLNKFDGTKNPKTLAFIKKISPVAWRHIHLNGHYTFKNHRQPIDLDVLVSSVVLG